MERWHLNMVMKEVRQWATWTFGRTTSQRNANRRGKSRNSHKFYFLGLPNHCRWWLQPWNSKTLAPWKKSYDELRQCIKKQRHHFANKHPYSQSYGFSSSHVRMWALDHKEGWAMKNWCFQTVVLEKTSESLGQQEIKPVNPDENQPWLFIDCSLEGLMVKLKLQHFVHLMLRANSLEKTLMLGKTESKRRGDRGWDGLMASPTQWTCILDKLREVVKDREA